MTNPPDTEDFHTLYIVTQLFECDLERIISSNQKLTDQHAQYFTYQILRGLKYIHSTDVIHRDLKPSNILVNSNCDLAICDFGLSRGIITSGPNDLTEYVVTRWYRSPEILCETSQYGTSVDLWSVGCILGEIINRKPILKGSSTREQVELILNRLGTPSEEEITANSSKAVGDALRRMNVRNPTPLKDFFPTASPLALDLLSKLLVFDPRKRFSIDVSILRLYSRLHG